MHTREITYQEAISEALQEEMRKDDTIFIMGEDILYRGTFGVTKGFVEEFGRKRIIQTPISESGFTGAAIGAAMMGMKPVVEILLNDFILRAMDSIANQAAKYRYMCGGGEFRFPIVIRVGGCGGAEIGSGCHHAQSLEAPFMHFPGLKVVMTSTPYDAKGLLKSSLWDNNPVLFFEHKLLYPLKGTVPEEEYSIPLGLADIKKEGDDITIIAHSLMARRALSVAEKIEEEGITVEVVDPRTLLPLDKKTILESAKKTGRVVIVEEGCKTGGVGAEIAAIIAEEIFEDLRAPIKRVAAKDTVLPSSRYGGRLAIPSEDDIYNAIKNLVSIG